MDDSAEIKFSVIVGFASEILLTSYVDQIY